MRTQMTNKGSRPDMHRHTRVAATQVTHIGVLMLQGATILTGIGPVLIGPYCCTLLEYTCTVHTAAPHLAHTADQCCMLCVNRETVVANDVLYLLSDLSPFQC